MVTATRVIEEIPLFAKESGDFILHAFYKTNKKFKIIVTQISNSKTVDMEVDAWFHPDNGVFDPYDIKNILAHAETMCEQLLEVNPMEKDE